MADYVHTYTGAQIDEAVGKVRDINSEPEDIDSAVTLAAAVSDHIVDTHISTTTGEWSYIKFDSGAIVMWGQHTITPQGSTASGSGYFSDIVTLSTSTGTPASNVGVAYAVISGTVDDRYVIVNPGNSFANKTIQFRLWRSMAVADTAVTARLLVVGKWKE